MKSKNRTIFFLILICFNTLSFGSNQINIESLKVLLESSKNNPEQDSALRSINGSLFKLEKDSALYYWDLLIDYCDETAYSYGKANFYLNKAIRLNEEGEYLESNHAFQESKSSYEIINNKQGLARVYNGLGVLFKSLNKFEQSYENFLKSAELFRELEETKNEGFIYLNIGGILEDRDSIKKAKEYLGKSKNILEELNDPNLISCYINLGQVHFKEKNDSAYYYFIKSHELSKNQGDANDKFLANYHLGEHLLEKNNFLEAETLLTVANNIAKDPKNINLISIENKAEFTKLLSNLHAKKGDYINAYTLLTQYLEFEIENNRALSNLELSRQDFELYERETSYQLKRGENRLIFTLVGLLFSILLIFILYRSYKTNQKANRLLTEMDDLKTKLYSNISHELRTPLTLILGPLEQMLSSDAPKKPTRKQIKMIRKNANNVLTLVNQMLDLAKIDAKKLKLNLFEYDLIKFIRIRLGNFTTMADQKNITFNLYLPDKKHIHFFDGSKLEKIINNLLSNAIKFTPQNGQVSCHINITHPKTLEMLVEDSGKGIPKNELNKIFDRFHQVADSDNFQQPGTGIGLALTKELIKMMHGTIKVESALNRGTKFKIRIPLGKEHLNSDEYVLVNSNKPVNTEIYEEIDEESENTEKFTSDVSKPDFPKILIVEDHQEIREFIKENLKDLYTVELAENGKIGLTKAIESLPDLVITDLMMPEMNGNELCEKLKSDEKTGHIPVIVLTALTGEKIKLESLETGADAYLSKPFNINELQIRIKNLIGQRKKLRERYTQNIYLEPKDIAITSADEKFLNKAMDIIEENIGNADFEVQQFQDKMFMSRMQLYRKIKALTNQNPSEFIRTIRLKRAASLMDKKFGNIAQITYEVGFNNPSYFAKCFKELFGKLPSEYMQKNQK